MHWTEGSRVEHDAPLPTGKRSRGELDAPRTSEPTGKHIYLICDDWPWGYSIRKLKLPLRSPYQLRPFEQRSLRRRLKPHRPEPKCLPPPCICLEAPRRYPMFFAAVGTNIIAAHPRSDMWNPKCILPIFDVHSQGFRFGPGLLYATNPIFITVGDEELFALERDSFSVLSMKPLCHPSQEWSWCDLPRAPEPLKSMYVTSFAVDSDGCTIFFSTDCATFAYNIVNREWKQSSNCSLPFTGLANYVHALDVFVGLSKDPDTYGHLSFCRKLGGDENFWLSKENLMSMDPAESDVGGTLVYLGGCGPRFCLVQRVCLEECDELVKCVDEGGGNCGEQDQVKKNLDEEGDGVSGCMQECGEVDHQLKTFVDEGHAYGRMHARYGMYLYRLTTFSLSFDNNGDLTTGDTCVVQCYKVPKEISKAMFFANPLAFWL